MPVDLEPLPEIIEPEPEVDPHVLDARRLRDRMIESSRARRAGSGDADPVDPELPNWYDPAPLELSPKRKVGRSGR